jgi:hypothetical protein
VLQNERESTKDFFMSSRRVWVAHSSGACLEQRRPLLPVRGFYRTDGLLGKEAKVLLKKLSARLAEKWEKPCSGRSQVHQRA